MMFIYWKRVICIISWRRGEERRHRRTSFKKKGTKGRWREELIMKVRTDEEGELEEDTRKKRSK